jgi:hypothetical protein
MRRGLTLGAATVAVLGLVLSGCAAQRASPRSDPPGNEGTSEVSAVELVGIWKVDDTEGEGDDTWLKIGGTEFVLWHECAIVFGSFRASGPLLLANPDAQHTLPECTLPEGPPAVPWLTATTSFRPADGGWELVDSDGGVTARLSADEGEPPATPGVDDSIRDEPAVTDEIRALLASPVLLPTELRPEHDLVGRWLPVLAEGNGADAEQPTTEPFVEFAADGMWTGSDGCNGQGGRWAATDDGNLVATAGPSTLIYCEGAPVGSWLSATALAGVADTRLVLLDPTGREVGRLVRAGDGG